MDTSAADLPGVARHDEFHLANTTHDLLKFQLSEENPEPHPKIPSNIDFDCHLQAFASKVASDDDSVNDEFSHTEERLGATTPSEKSFSTNYLNLKVMIENAVFDSLDLGPHAVVLWKRLQRLKAEIADLKEKQLYVRQRLEVSSQFCSSFIFNRLVKEVDQELAYNLLRQNSGLHTEYFGVSDALEREELTLRNHNLACLMMGYVEDVKKGASTESARALGDVVDSIFAHLAAVAAHRHIELPQPLEGDVHSLEARVTWAQQCIDALAAGPPSPPKLAATADTSVLLHQDSVLRDHSFLSATPYKEQSSEKVISEYRMALNDLRFSHEYFMKEYEYLKENSLKTILEYRRKNAALEKELLLGRDVVLRDLLDSKEKEISRLKRELLALKVDTLGNKRLSDLHEKDQLVPPTSTSNAILRKEFKVIVLEMQSQYEVELGEERLQRRRLEEKLAALNV